MIQQTFDIEGVEPDPVPKPGRTMPCLSLWQPWASLIAVGVKTIETRSWKAPNKFIGKRIAIHAAKNTKGMTDARLNPKLHLACHRALMDYEVGRLPFGAVLCTAILTECRRTQYCEPDIYGDFTLDRWGWILEDIRKLDEPLPARGAQGIFKVEFK